MRWNKIKQLYMTGMAPAEIARHPDGAGTTAKQIHDKIGRSGWKAEKDEYQQSLTAKAQDKLAEKMADHAAMGIDTIRGEVLPMVRTTLADIDARLKNPNASIGDHIRYARLLLDYAHALMDLNQIPKRTETKTMIDFESDEIKRARAEAAARVAELDRSIALAAAVQ